MSVFGTARRCASRFLLSDERGGITVEAVLWLPIYLGFISFIVDVSMVLHNQSQAMRIVQDGHRAASLAPDPDATTIQEAIKSRLQRFSGNVSVTSEISDGVLQTVVSMPVSDLDAIGFITTIADIDLRWANYHLVERT